MPPQSTITHGLRTSLWGLLVNTGLVAVKLTAGLLGHSQALIADAIESSLDVFSSFVVWHGLRISEIPADADHPYGHGRAESLAGLFVAMMLFVVAAGIAFEAVQDLLAGHREPPAWFTLPILLAVVVLKETMFRIVRRVGDRLGSNAVQADAGHHRSDALTSATAAVGISIALWGGPAYAAADNWAALAASAVISFNAFLLVRRPIHELMDTRPHAIVDEARRVARETPGVLGVEKVLARKSGLRYYVDMHIEVDPETTVREGHLLAHTVKDTIRLAMPNVEDVLVHIEPFNPGRTG